MLRRGFEPRSLPREADAITKIFHRAEVFLASVNPGIGGAMLHLEFIGDSLLMSWIGLLSIASLVVFAYKSPNEEVATLFSWIVVLYLALTIGYGIVYQLINPQAGYIPYLLLSFGGTVVYSVFTMFVCQIIIFIIPFAKFLTSDSEGGGRPVEKDILTEEEYEEFKPHPTNPEFVPIKNYYQINKCF